MESEIILAEVFLELVFRILTKASCDEVSAVRGHARSFAPSPRRCWR